MQAEIREYILNQLSKHPSDITTITSKKFKKSRQTIINYLTQLSSEGLITSAGKTRACEYKLIDFIKKQFHEIVSSDIAEDVLWRANILPLMKGIKPNVIDICQYGFTEIVRNVFDHSQSKTFLYTITRNAVCIELDVFDHGVGIFNKIQRDFNLNDPRHALLELSKGKLSSDPERHSGEGIFFTSRMFDSFSIYSRPLFYSQESKKDGWLLETGDSKNKGTLVTMEISPYSTRKVQNVFDEFAPDKDSFGFTKTHVPIKLAKYEGEQLVSRSQARRLLARFERFSEVLLDFKGVTIIGQAFADEIFRVYQLEHPTIMIVWVNTNKDVEKMILRVRAELISSSGVPIEQQKLL